MHSIKSNFDKIICILKDVLGENFPVSGNLLPLRPGPKQKFTDVEVIALSLTSQCMTIESENKLFHLLNSSYKKDFPHLISRRQYNDRLKGLNPHIDEINKLIASKMDKNNNLYIVDSMPLEICSPSRKNRTTICKENPNCLPNKGYCAAQKKHYYGFKLHTICNEQGTIIKFDLTKASLHDIKFLEVEGKNFKDCMILGDKGYQSKKLTEDLLNHSNVVLQAPFKSNQKEKKPLIPGFGRKRKRIETVFSQLDDQFIIQKNFAKTFIGLTTRILSKITGMTILQYINKFITKKPIGKIKYALI